MSDLPEFNLLRSGPGNARLLEIRVGNKKMVTPTYFPAISKKEIRDPADKFLELVTMSRYPRLLVSAYDYGKTRSIAQRKAMRKLCEYNKHTALIMLDSGVYEAYWRENSRWGFRSYREAVNRIGSDLFLSYDILPTGRSRSSFRQLTLTSILDSSKLGEHCIPIVHELTPLTLLDFVRYLTRKAPTIFRRLAVSERELGRGISERCNTVKELRSILNRNGEGFLHILGCGEPISMASYAYCGADSFDSLDWATKAFDPVGERLLDISHFELLGCKCDVCTSLEIDQSSKVYLHNLLFFQRYSMKLHTMIRERTLADYLQELTSKEFVKGFGLAPSQGSL